jgi:hypothetical protein
MGGYGIHVPFLVIITHHRFNKGIVDEERIKLATPEE